MTVSIGGSLETISSTPGQRGDSPCLPGDLEG